MASKAHREAGKKSEIRSAKVGDRARAKRIDRQAKAKVKRLERHRAKAPKKRTTRIFAFRSRAQRNTAGE